MEWSCGRGWDYHGARSSPADLAAVHVMGAETLRFPKSGAVLVLLATATWSLHVRAAGTESAAQCARVTDDDARLACYDGIFRPGGEPQQAAPRDSSGAVIPAAVAAGAAAPAVVSNPEEDFGLTEAAKQARKPDAPAAPPESISRKVSSVTRRPTGEFVVTLDDGQVWSQIESYPAVRLSAGETVTIKKASLGSYLLVTSTDVGTRVKRIR
jgi:hypothetical protein